MSVVLGLVLYGKTTKRNVKTDSKQGNEKCRCTSTEGCRSIVIRKLKQSSALLNSL